MSSIQTRREVMLGGVTATTTSSAKSVDNAGRLSLQLVTNATSGTAVWTVEISNDSSNWVAYNRLTSNATNTNSQQDTRVASLSVAAASQSDFLFFPPGDTFNFLRAKVTVTGTVAASAIAFIS